MCGYNYIFEPMSHADMKCRKQFKETKKRDVVYLGEEVVLGFVVFRDELLVMPEDPTHQFLSPSFRHPSKSPSHRLRVCVDGRVRILLCRLTRAAAEAHLNRARRPTAVLLGPSPIYPSLHRVVCRDDRRLHGVISLVRPGSNWNVFHRNRQRLSCFSLSLCGLFVYICSLSFCRPTLLCPPIDALRTMSLVWPFVDWNVIAVVETQSVIEVQRKIEAHRDDVLYRLIY